jgi:single-strand DNA-binding protein
MSDRNLAMLVGNLGDEPEIFTTSTGKRVATFRLCTKRVWRNGAGEEQEKKNWHTVKVWDSQKGLFGFVERFLGKGDRVDVVGEIDYDSYVDSEGRTIWKTIIKAREIRAAGELSGPEARGRGRGSQRRSQAPAPAGVGGGGGGQYDDFQAPPFEDDDDLPF